MLQIKLDKLPLLQVIGEGRVEVVPDTAVLSLGVAVRAEQASAAYQQTVAVAQQIVRALLEIGIPQEQMQTGRVGLQPIYERGERLVGYEGSATLRITLRDLGAVGNVIDVGVAAGANRVDGVSFEVRDPSARESHALELAVQDAQRQAETLARSLGIGLGPVWRVEAEPGPGPVYPLMAAPAAREALPVLPGTVDLTRRVRVEYLIQSA